MPAPQSWIAAYRALRAVADADLDRVAECAGEIGQGVPLDERHLGPRLDHDRQVREDRGSVGVDVRPRLQWQVDPRVAGHVQGNVPPVRKAPRASR